MGFRFGKNRAFPRRFAPSCSTTVLVTQIGANLPNPEKSILVLSLYDPIRRMLRFVVAKAAGWA